jgi:clan AA aspartic protease (TIGR02281 family)
MRKTDIKMDKRSNILMIDLAIWSNVAKRLRNIMVVFDTGASVTTISKDILYQLGYDVTNCRKSRITTASGVAYVDVVVLDKLKIGDLELKEIEVYAHTFPEESFAIGVLGLNVISQFNVSLNFENNIISLQDYDTEELK